MKNNIGPLAFHLSDNRPFWETGIQWRFDIRNDLASIRRLPANKPICTCGRLEIFRPYLEHFLVLHFPEDCPGGKLELTVTLKRRPDMFGPMRPVVTCIQAGDHLPAIAFKKHGQKKTDTDYIGKRFRYIEETFIATVDLTLLYKSLKSFFENQRLTNKHFFGSGDLRFELSMDTGGGIVPIGGHSIVYFLPMFHEKTKKFFHKK